MGNPRPVAIARLFPLLPVASTCVAVAPGVHTVRLSYRGFPDYPQLLVLGIAAVAVLGGIERPRRRRAWADRSGRA